MLLLLLAEDATLGENKKCNNRQSADVPAFLLLYSQSYNALPWLIDITRRMPKVSTSTPEESGHVIRCVSSGLSNAFMSSQRGRSYISEGCLLCSP